LSFANVTERTPEALVLQEALKARQVGCLAVSALSAAKRGQQPKKAECRVQIGQLGINFLRPELWPWIGGDPFRTSYTVNLGAQNNFARV
jgi:hypothetical protein